VSTAAAALADVVPIGAAAGARDNEALLAQYRVTGAPDLLDRLVRDNQGLVHHLLKRFRYADEPYEDLVQVANLGLIKAAHSFDAARGARFCTYAAVVIEGEIRHHLRDTLLLRQPRWVKRLHGQIRATTIDLGNKLGRAPEIREIAQAMNVKEEGIREVLALYARLELYAWDQPDGDDGMPAIDRHVLRSLHHESFTLPVEDRVALEAALERLTDFQRRVVDLLFYRELTQAEVAQAMGVTHKKVTRELHNALGRLREVMGKRVF
jgi:RNA polymerase sigma-B factor